MGNGLVIPLYARASNPTVPFAFFRKFKFYITEKCKIIMIILTEFATMKTPIRYTFIILILGLFSSCAEQFQEIRGSENRGNAFLSTGLTSATKRTQKAKCESISPQQSVIPLELAASEIAVESTPNPNPIEPKIEKVETNQTCVITGQKGSVVSKTNGSSANTLKKKKLSKPARILKKAVLQWGNGNDVNGYLIALGILGIIGSVIGILTALWGFLWSEELIFAGLGVLFLLSFISSIWLIASPNLEDANILKTIAIILAAVPVFLIFIWFLAIFIDF